MNLGRTYDRIILATVATFAFASQALGDPPPPPSDPTICPTVQCMRVNDITDNLDGTFDVEFETFNWFNTDADDGVNSVVFFTGNLQSKLCIDFAGVVIPQVEVIGATAPSGWTVASVSTNEVRFDTTSTASEIPELDLCDANVIGGCINGGGPGISTCGNEQGGFVVTLRPGVSVGSLCSWTANWRHLDEFGLDNGDVMNFGSVSWTFGSLIEDYSNNGYPPSSFAQTGVDACAQKVQKKAAKYALQRLKQYGKCIDKVNLGKTCDETKRDEKVDKKKVQLENAIDQFCTDAQVLNVPWCGTTTANLKTCLVAELDTETDEALATIYGP